MTSSTLLDLGDQLTIGDVRVTVGQFSSVVMGDQ
jgi:hypothetical protein